MGPYQILPGSPSFFYESLMPFAGFVLFFLNSFPRTFDQCRTTRLVPRRARDRVPQSIRFSMTIIKLARPTVVFFKFDYSSQNSFFNVSTPTGQSFGEWSKLGLAPHYVTADATVPSELPYHPPTRTRRCGLMIAEK